MRLEGKLLNTDGEFIASGPCEVDLDRDEVTMWPSWEMHMLERQRGQLRLELDDGRRLNIGDKHLTFKLSGPSEQRISVYRLRIIDRVPEHLSARYVEQAPQEHPATEPAPAADEAPAAEELQPRSAP
ncbi:MAG TPA: hypothetical protein VFY79_13985 [Dehalococcoidia bacterium]|nr:hypothetical protein [Dehalococcoidia bacterium]